MRTMRDDEFMLTGRWGGRSRPILGVSGIVLVLVSIGLMVLSRLDHSYVRVMRLHITELVTPLLAATRAAVSPVETAVRRFARQIDRASEFEALERQVKELESWKWRAEQLERRVLELSRASRVAAEPVMPFTTARVVATATGPFASSAVVAVGRSHGVRAGHPAMDADGLVGRIVEAGDAAARVLLASDPSSRIPVEFGVPLKRAIVVGDGTTMPRLAHVRFGDDAAAGDEVVTSGVGGIYPRGLRLGVVVKADDGLRVRLHADLERLDYLSVLFFDTPMLDITDAGAPERRRRDLAAPLAVPMPRPKPATEGGRAGGPP